MIRQDFLVGAKISDPPRTSTLNLPSSLQMGSRLSALVLVVAIPGGKQDVLPTNEMAALRDIQTITSLQTQYMSQFGRYADSLAELGPQGADLIPASLASGRKDGYTFTLARTVSGYAVHAVPIVFGKDGRRTFYSDQTMIMHQNWGVEPASADSPEFK